MNLRKISLYLLIGSTVLSALIGIGVILFGDFGHFEVRILMTTLTVTAASIVGLACGANLESGRGKIIPFAGIAFAASAAVCTFFIIWNIADESTVFIKITATLTFLALSCSHLSLLGLAKLDERFRWSYQLAFVCIWLLTTILLFLMWFEPDVEGDLLSRFIGILAILTASLTVITPVFHYLSSHETNVTAIDAEIEKLRAKIAVLEEKRANLTKANKVEGPSPSTTEDRTDPD